MKEESGTNEGDVDPVKLIKDTRKTERASEGPKRTT
jgi:hypothetical protein